MELFFYRWNFPRWMVLIFVVTLGMLPTEIAAVSRRAMLGSALHLECRDNQTIKINSVILGKDRPFCSHTLSSVHADYLRVVDECSGLQSCANIVLKESTRIPCTNIGIQSSEYMTVNYTCITASSLMSVCHDTVKPVSVFDGYLSSPGYPLPPATSALGGVVCSCQINSMSSNAAIELILVDMFSSQQVEVTDPSDVTRYVCDSSRSNRCVNRLHSIYYSSVNITFRPGEEPAKFLLQYRAAGRSSRVRAICSKSMIASVNSDVTQAISRSTGVETQMDQSLQRDVLRLEVILSICIAAVILLTCVIVSVIVCRRYLHRKSTQKSATTGLFKTLTPDNNPTYDMVPSEHSGYDPVATSKVRRAGSEHFYHEPAEVAAEYSHPCVSHQHSRFCGDETDIADFNMTPRGLGVASTGSGIYESVEYMVDETLQRTSRMSMNKSGSMPLHPAPPIPRNAVSMKERAGNSQPIAVRAKSEKHPAGDRLQLSVDLITPQPMSDAKPKSDMRRIIHSPTSLGSMESINIDLTEVLIETDKRFEQHAGANNSHVDGDYMEPVKAVSFKKDGCRFVENELYITKP